MKILKFNELHIMNKDIIEDMVGEEYKDMKFTIEDMYKAYAEGEQQGHSGLFEYDFPEWIRKNY